MVRLAMILLGVDYLRMRWRGVMAIGVLSIALGCAIFLDALDGALYFPITPFAFLMLIEGFATLAVAWTGMGGQRTLRYVKGATFCLSALLVLIGGEHGNFTLSMIFGTLFLVDGALQIVFAKVVRYRRWKIAVAGGVLEIAIAIFFYQPYPDWYAGTVAYCVAFGLFFGGWNMILLASRVRRMVRNPADDDAGNVSPFANAVFEGPPEPHETALTVHVWTPVGSAKQEARRQLIVDRYIAAVDRHGAISTGHAALETPEGIYISLYPAVDIDRSPDEFARILRATRDNDVPGLWQPDYVTESTAWCESTHKVRIRNYDPERLARFWETYRRECGDHAAAGDDVGAVSGRAGEEARRDDGVDAGADAGLRAGVEHAGGPAVVGVGEDGAAGGEADGAGAAEVEGGGAEGGECGGRRLRGGAGGG